MATHPIETQRQKMNFSSRGRFEWNQMHCPKTII